MATESEPRPTITKVWAKNFRSIEHAELELGPLAVLVGPNASGKSNLLDVLGFLADAARDGLEAAVSRRGGIGAIGRKTPGGKALAPEIGLHYKTPEGTLQYSVTLMRRRNGEYRVKREFARLEPTRLDVNPFEVEITDRRLTKPDLKSIFKETGPTSDETSKRTAFQISTVKELISELGDQSLLLMPPERLRVTSLLIPLQSRTGSIVENPTFRLHLALENTKNYIGRIALYHIFPNSLRDPQKVSDSHPLTTGGENLASTLRGMVQKKSRFVSELKEALSVAVPGVRDTRVKQAGSYYVVEIYHERGGETPKGSWFDLSYESDGTIRLLAMLTALFQDPAPSLIGLEEPELAIHPGAMAVLADTMKEASLRGQVLVATHSPDLINLLPIDSIRAVTAESGSTKVGKVAEHQLKSVRDNLFLPGELHSMEGLQPAVAGNPTE